jgi:DNA methylase
MPRPSLASASAHATASAHEATTSAHAAAEPAIQLTLGLPDGLPALPLERDWKAQPRLWGHSLHPMCSYLASFPASLAHAFIARYSRPGDVVLDPFSGRGTTPLEACVEGRIGVGNDLNPFAHLLTAAKVDPPRRPEVVTRLTALRLAGAAGTRAWLELAHGVVDDPMSTLVPAAGSGAGPADGVEPVPLEVAVAFHPETLGELLAVRSALRLDDRVDRFLAAAIAGILHGKTPAYLSTVMPNTFSMAPRYVRNFVAETGFVPPRRDLFESLAAKLDRLARDPLPSTPGVALLGDARDAGERARDALAARSLPTRARLVVTSPPYLRVVRYGYYNWLRTWFLGFDAAAIDGALDDAHRRLPYLAFMREVLGGLRPALTDDAIAVLIIGDVETDRGRPSPDGLGLASAVWEEAAAPEGYGLAGVVRDNVLAGRKMTRLWGDEAGRATKTDRILVLAASEAGRRRAVAGARTPVSWDRSTRSLRAL